MKPRTITVLLTAAIALSSLAATAQRRPNVRGLLVWPGPAERGGGALVMQYVPGLDAALLLTDEQIDKIATAQTAQRETIKAAVGDKNPRDPNLTEAEKETMRKAYEEANAKLRETVTGILNADQKALIQKVGAAHEDLLKTVEAEFRQKAVAIPRDDQEAHTKLYKEMRDKVEADFTKMLDTLLTTEQRAAVAKAAAEEKKRAEEQKNAPRR